MADQVKIIKISNPNKAPTLSFIFTTGNALERATEAALKREGIIYAHQRTMNTQYFVPLVKAVLDAWEEDRDRVRKFDKRWKGDG